MAAKILVVEDEQVVALDIEKRASRLGYEVATTSSGEEALARVESWRPDLILMDIRLRDGMDGIEAAQRIRERYDLPVVFLTAYADARTLARARATEPYGYVVKPFDERGLAASIEMALQQHVARERERRQRDLQSFLARASAELAASLDVGAVARQATELLVPRYADWCLVSLADRDSDRWLAVAHPAIEGQDANRVRRALAASGKGGGARLVEETTPGALAGALGEEDLAALRRAGLEPRSLITAPLLALGPPLGAIALLSGGGRRSYGPADLVFAEDFAHRLALAFANAVLYRKSERAVRARDEVLAVVSHDLRGALSSILVGATTLLRQDAGSRPARAILRAGRHMDRLIDDLLDAAALDAGGLSFEPRPQSAARVAREAIDAVRPVAEIKALTLAERLPDEGVRLLGDRGRIVQVLSNLIGNAIKFSPRGASITVSAWPDGSFVRFAVSDEGPGIPAEELPHLFERFWQGRAHQRGTGLGLYIARRMVELHGGRIWVESAPGAGTTVSFTCPRAAAAEERPPARPA